MNEPDSNEWDFHRWNLQFGGLPETSDLPLNIASVSFVEQMYLDYQRDPLRVPEPWREYFTTLNLPSTGSGGTPLQQTVDVLTRNYRSRGHLIARINPLAQPKTTPKELDPKSFGLSDEDMKRPCSSPAAQKLHEAIAALNETYCGPLGVEFMHLDDPAARKWLQRRMEAPRTA